MSESSEEFCVYEVKSGDSLSAIAAHFGDVTPTQIARINHLPLMSCGLPPVFPGQRLIIPVASRTQSNSTKIKRLPGVALRVEDADKQNAGGKNTGYLPVEPFFYTTRVRVSPQSSGSIDDDALERQFVKVEAHRVLKNLDNLIDGVLLVTPESLCFDASKTAVAQKEAYIASHSGNDNHDDTVNSEIKLTSPHDSDDHDQQNDRKSPSDHPLNFEFSCCNIPQELLNLGLCIPLNSISAMKTLSEKDVVRYLSPATNRKRTSLSSDSSSCQSEEAQKPQSTSVNDVISKSMDKDDGDNQRNILNKFTSEQPTEIIKSIHEDSSNPTPNTITDEQHDDHSNPDILSKTNPTKPSSPSECLSPISSEILENTSKSQSSPEKSDSGCNSVSENSIVKYLYLRISVTEGENHIFRLTVDRLTQVYSFLLRAGVGSSDPSEKLNDHPENTVDEVDGSQLREKGQNLESTDTTQQRRSLVEEILESMEESIPIASLSGGESRILTDEMLADLSVNFPAQWIGSNLVSIYKSEDDGYCLNTVYRKCKDVEGGVLLLIRDTMGVVFGAVMSEGMKCSKGFYGTGETFVFHWKPTFKKYCWTKKNYFFMRGSPHSFHIGGQSGRNAIWFDESLKYGRSEPTDTYDNPVLSGNLPDIQFSSVSIDTAQNTQSINNPPESIKKQSSTMMYNSVPFVIDTVELWQLVS
ncbi:unnamed protein product [Trichobilharzia szidati]|nr:unnamed protein product [Trichobilharzia szidati]CAH8828210.1 unnamed protein product [Trichobilharzia szidati]